jgi:tRNA(Arg) A34 adenosine deaminase TadA
MKRDDFYIKRCIKLSKKSLKDGELPFGSVIVKGDRIIAESGNRTKVDGDITSHAEWWLLKRPRRFSKHRIYQTVQSMQAQSHVQCVHLWLGN